jgi:hypothetical protein
LKIITHRPDKIAVNDRCGFEYEVKKNFEYYKGDESHRTFIDLCTINACYGDFCVGAEIWFCWYNESLKISWSKFEWVINNVISINIPPRWDSDLIHKSWYYSIAEKLFPEKHIYFNETRGSGDPMVIVNKKKLKCVSTSEMITTFRQQGDQI